MENKALLQNILDSEHFDGECGHYFIDIKRASNANHFLCITRLHPVIDHSIRRSQVILFEEDIPFFMEAITMLLSRYASGNLGAAC
ncbi:hypothetical protein FO440_20625 [Mucilaginibacter corticis]|uniref:Uncharacterized protein n=1 Tax=Mucilaginibacter corticis TaxID=2597670 RepID=A0A556MG48_9SPHI|nr:hypothetical protein [Mucilaginibacter corticis]TSJ38906.1 hypothetical protein FO440_20625 [Mucilaginibacter corticis]